MSEPELLGTILGAITGFPIGLIIGFNYKKILSKINITGVMKRYK